MTRAVGRRKEAAARVRITPGKGEIIVNGKEFKTYFTTLILQNIVSSPLEVTGKLKDLDVSVKVAGGGSRGQAEAVRHGISRALVEWNADLKPALKAEGFMTRDARTKERKKPGLLKARRGRQWKKR
ncbi:MAG: 30S ribosomal protein S9 [Candidatus Magasanikbacteria bacterium CG_4_9_14_0_2_um_filter_42_11]|uniref:30S ribosomal protein S9 n=1 Tax=Candidatus Magasanikbacteria bacterium CG_4_9_14_0_2_um_filter_42_11 TaxID=1974643 RepID=A0A2M8F8T3_9BACT|nr:MAG: 30S ribosomal protein S9 [Candidatus Magasanikbacteria bacterium CG10_big_fil_rev_8_21_14_0_10_43_9]PIY92680.1 MAG: 30S ribosomal protein S9 [Candidatus Magasanikbacteria bacterium CG_4_10_14_0_8_um_filter_42_12]PJC52132.1 MAG: 30S ribosomal protein S9 [Candidatus Magasanikbacteria bacterium CG_4_9_14_0_2_um_filter_42_11]